MRQKPNLGLAGLKASPFPSPDGRWSLAKRLRSQRKRPMSPLRQQAKNLANPRGNQPNQRAKNQAKPARSPARASPPRPAKSLQERLKSGVTHPRSRAAASRVKKRPRTIAVSWPATPVKTATGYTPIEALKVGDLVQSEDPKTGTPSLQRVTQVIVRPMDKIKTFYKLSVSKDGSVEDFYVTGEHRFGLRTRLRGRP